MWRYACAKITKGFCLFDLVMWLRFAFMTSLYYDFAFSTLRFYDWLAVLWSLRYFSFSLLCYFTSLRYFIFAVGTLLFIPLRYSLFYSLRYSVGLLGLPDRWLTWTSYSLVNLRFASFHSLGLLLIRYAPLGFLTFATIISIRASTSILYSASLRFNSLLTLASLVYLDFLPLRCALAPNCHVSFLSISLCASLQFARHYFSLVTLRLRSSLSLRSTSIRSTSFSSLSLFTFYSLRFRFAPSIRLSLLVRFGIAVSFRFDFVSIRSSL